MKVEVTKSFEISDKEFYQAVEKALKNNEDFVEVVRCKDCAYFDKKDSMCERCGDINESCGACHYNGCCTNDDGYCHHGERRKNDE